MRKTQDPDRVRTEDFEPYWDRILAIGQERFRVTSRSKSEFSGLRTGSFNGRFDVRAFCVWLGITRDEYDTIQKLMGRKGRRSPLHGTTLSFGLCDRILTSMGWSHYVSQLPIYTRRGRLRGQEIQVQD